MPLSSIGGFNLYNTSLLVRADHHCEGCGVYSECFSLSHNGFRHLVVHVIEEGSGIYAVVPDVSLDYYCPEVSYGISDSVRRDNVSICAAMFCTRHAFG
jgi:hypothetical protein